MKTVQINKQAKKKRRECVSVGEKAEKKLLRKAKKCDDESSATKEEKRKQTIDRNT